MKLQLSLGIVICFQKLVSGNRDFDQMGNVLLLGSKATGKTTILQTLNELHPPGITFDTTGLGPFALDNLEDYHVLITIDNMNQIVTDGSPGIPLLISLLDKINFLADRKHRNKRRIDGKQYVIIAVLDTDDDTSVTCLNMLNKFGTVVEMNKFKSIHSGSYCRACKAEIDVSRQELQSDYFTRRTVYHEAAGDYFSIF